MGRAWAIELVMTKLHLDNHDENSSRNNSLNGMFVLSNFKQAYNQFEPFSVTLQDLLPQNDV